jgi:iron complex transport system permease protein
MNQRPSFVMLLGLLGAAVCGLFVASLLVGPSDLTAGRALEALFVNDGAATLVMREIRLPRALLGVSVGATLGLAGAVLQGWLRNPLADSGVLGIGSSAALGAVAAIVGGLAELSPLALPLAALAGAGASSVLVFLLAGRGEGCNSLILAGVAMASLTAALTALVLNLSANPFATLEIVFWTMGSLSDRSLDHVALALPFMAFGWLLLARVGRSLDAMTLGAETAQSLGVRLERVRAVILFATAASIGAATAVTGVVGFVGLVVPHVLRPLVGARPSRLMAASAFGGAALLTAADLLVRLIVPDRDIKLGVVTAIVGAPFFFHLILHERRKAAR